MTPLGSRTQSRRTTQAESLFDRCARPDGESRPASCVSPIVARPSPDENRSTRPTISAVLRSAPPVRAVRPGGLQVRREPVGRSVTLSSVRVMVVDDDADVCTLMRRVLGDAGASVETANRAQEALDRIDAFQPNLLVSDIGMPEKDGYSLIPEIPSRGLGHNRLPALALTSLARVEDRRRALLAGYQIHIAKPVDPSELIAAIATRLGMTGREDVD